MDSESKSDSTKETLSSGPSSDLLEPLFPSMPTSGTELPTSATVSSQGSSIVTEQLQMLKLQIAQFKLASSKFEAASKQIKYVTSCAALRPCHLYPVKLYHNDVTWVCQSLQDDNAVGCGDSPGQAMTAFDAMWLGNGLDG